MKKILPVIFALLCLFTIGTVFGAPELENAIFPEHIYSGQEFRIGFSATGTDLLGVLLYKDAYTGSSDTPDGKFTCTSDDCSGYFDITLNTIGNNKLVFVVVESDGSIDMRTKSITVESPVSPTFAEFEIPDEIFVKESFFIDFQVSGMDLTKVKLLVKDSNHLIVGIDSKVCTGNICEGSFEQILNSPGTYTISLAAEDEFGSRVIETKIVQVLENYIPIFGYVSVPENIFAGHDFNILFSVSGTELNNVRMIIKDSNKNPVTSGEYECLSSSLCSGLFNAELTNTGNYYITLMANDDYGSTVTKTIQITVDSVMNPTFEYMGLPEEITLNTPFTISYSVVGEDLTSVALYTDRTGTRMFIDSDSCSGNSCSGEFTISLSKYGDYDITLAANDGFGSRIELSKTITVITGTPSDDTDDDSDDDSDDDTDDTDDDSDDDSDDDTDDTDDDSDDDDSPIIGSISLVSPNTGINNIIIEPEVEFSFIPSNDNEWDKCTLYVKDASSTSFTSEGTSNSITPGIENSIIVDMDDIKSILTWKVRCFVGSSSVNSTERNTYIQTESKIIITEIEAEYISDSDSESETFDIEDLLSGNIKLKKVDRNSEVTLKITARNLNEDSDSDYDMDAKVTVESNDLDDDIEQEFSKVIKSGSTRTQEITFTIPSDAENSLDLDISVEGEDESDSYTDDVSLTIEVEQPSGYWADIEEISLTRPTLSCTRSTSLNIDFSSIGTKDLDEVMIKATSEAIGLAYSEEDISVDDDTVSLNIPVVVKSIQKKGTYKIDVKLYRDNNLGRLIDGGTASINLVVEDCVQSSSSTSTSTIKTTVVSDKSEDNFDGYYDMNVPLTSDDGNSDEDFENLKIGGLVIANASVASAAIFLGLKFIKF